MKLINSKDKYKRSENPVTLLILAKRRLFLNKNKIIKKITHIVIMKSDYLKINQNVFKYSYKISLVKSYV